MTVLKSYDLNGKQLSFANWISNLSPSETPFVSMTGKESIEQVLFQWQTDSLDLAQDNAFFEGEVAVESNQSSTLVKQNNTQIIRKVVRVSDTSNSLANYGRGEEIKYQMEKAGKEIKRDLEWAFLNNTQSSPEEKGDLGRVTAGFKGLCSPLYTLDLSSGAVVHKDVSAFSEASLFDLTYNLYLAGSRADIIMFHPKHADFFSSLQEKDNAPNTKVNRARLFKDTPKLSVYVSTITDPLGQVYKLVPNRWMPEDSLFFFTPSDWTQMVLRAPSRTKLSKKGSSEKWMIEMEVGLRHRNPFASGILSITDKSVVVSPESSKVFSGTPSSLTPDGTTAESSASPGFSSGVGKEIVSTMFHNSEFYVANAGESLRLSLKGNATTADGSIPAGGIVLSKDGVNIWENDKAFSYGPTNQTDWTDKKVENQPGPAPTPPSVRQVSYVYDSVVVIPSLSKMDAGYYMLTVTSGGKVIESLGPIALAVSDGSNTQNPLQN